MSTLRFVQAALTVAIATCGSAYAQTKTWNFGDQISPGSCDSFTVAYGNSTSCSEQPSGTTKTLNVSAFSSDGTSSAYRTAALNYWGTGSGFGAYNQTEGLSAVSPQHAMDNYTPGIDMMLLSFTSSEVLKQVTVGWSDTDGDFQVLAWTGASNASLSTVQSSITGKTASTMVGTGGGWKLISTVDGAGGINTPDVNYDVNSGNVSSSYWIISAYNSSFGGSSMTVANDAIKVLGVMSGVPSGGGGVPVPGTLALAGLGLAAMARVRRRRA